MCWRAALHMAAACGRSGSSGGQELSTTEMALSRWRSWRESSPVCAELRIVVQIVERALFRVAWGMAGKSARQPRSERSCERPGRE
jgi:hypothetical protein